MAGCLDSLAMVGTAPCGWRRAYRVRRVMGIALDSAGDGLETGVGQCVAQFLRDPLGQLLVFGPDHEIAADPSVAKEGIAADRDAVVGQLGVAEQRRDLALG